MKRETHEILLKPLMTEKQLKLQEAANIYYFAVPKDCNKCEIKTAVEKAFSVKVLAVNTVITRGKWKRVGRTFGRYSNWKKAAVKLAEGDKIALFESI